MSGIILGKTAEGKSAHLDLNVLLRSRLLIQANSGKGKSWLLRRLAEQLFGKIQVIIIDPEGEFATLREKYAYVLVGKGGETQAHARIAALTAQRLLELRCPAVCDLYELKPSERHGYVRAFLDGMIDAPKSLWHPLIVILDEAHVYCPEKGAGESEAAESVIGLATRGRKRGYCLIPATQRLGKFRKDAAAEMLNVMIGGTFIDIDRKRAADALGVYGAEVHNFFDAIRVLERGLFYALGPAISTERILIQVGSVETTHPEAGSAKHALAAPPTPEKIRRLLPKLADLPQEAEEKARTEAELRVEIRSLKAQLRAQPQVSHRDTEATEKANQLVKELERKLREAQRLMKERDRIIGQFREQAKRLLECTESLAAMPDSELQIPKGPRAEAVRQVRVPQAQVPRPALPVAPRPPRVAESNGSLPKGERIVLTAIAQYPEGVTREQLTILTGYRRSTRDAYVQRLSEKGYAGTGGLGLLASQEGIQALGAFEPLPTGPELADYWLNRLTGGERAILKILLEAGGEPVSREKLSELAEYARSSRDAYLQRLQARRLIQNAGPGAVKASEELFD